MRLIDQLVKAGFVLKHNVVGVDTTTLVSSEVFYYYNPRFCTTAEIAHNAITNDCPQGVKEMTVPTSSVNERWPYVIMNSQQVEALADIAYLREKAQDLRNQAHALDHQVVTGFNNLVSRVGD